MESEVTVTHFINPHLFWFKTIGADNPEKVHVLSVLEQNLEELYKNKPPCDNQLRPQVGDKVAVNFIARNKFMRAEVLQKAEFQQEEYIVWAIDYGFPLLTKKEYLRYLPTNLRQDIGLVRVGGIANIYPAEQDYDDEECNLILVKKDKWVQRTCNVLEKLLTDASSINFVLRFRDASNHNWGDLTVVNHRGNKINAVDFLLKTTNAIKADNELIFQEKSSTLNTIKIAPWLSNDRNTKMKFNTIKHNYSEHSQQMLATIIDELAKRKVQDWQKRNEKGTIDELTEITEPACVEADSNAHVDDVTFDDSVSVVQERNYMGKAGALTINKRRNYFPNKDLSPSVLQKAFEMDNIEPSDRSVSNFPRLPESSLSISSNISKRMQKLELLRRSSARAKEKQKHIIASERCPPQPQMVESNERSSIASSSIRYQQLMEMRKKLANMQKQKKNIGKNNSETNKVSMTAHSADLKDFQNFNERENLSTTDSTIKIGDSEFSFKIKPNQQKFEDKGNDTQPNNKDLGLIKEKEFLKVKDSTTHNGEIALPEDSSSVKKTTINEKLKFDQAGYDSFTLLPAGYDITRLNTYKDEENHWHRKKTTRFDSVAHDSTTSYDDVQFSNNKNHFSQTSPGAKASNTTTNYSQYSNQTSETSANHMNIEKSFNSNKIFS